jgi:hypothetical protein
VEGPTRRKLSGILATCAAVASIAAVAQAAKEPVQMGVFALVGGTESTKAEYRSGPANGGGIRVRVRQFQEDGKTPIVAYSVTGERTMQMIVIRDDFATYQHVNPSIDATTGTFHETLTGLDAAHRYYLYADSIPASTNEQVFRFNVQAEHIPAVAPASKLTASANWVTTGAYNVTIGSTAITADQPSKILISVKEHNKMAWDLEPYQGAPAFATMINASTLEYIHVKPYLRGSSSSSARNDAMGGVPQAGPYMSADLPALPAGPYKLWIQIRGAAGKLYIAPFTIVAQ